MIETKADLRMYLEADRVALGIKSKRPPIIGKEVWKFEIALRKYEYALNIWGGVRALLRKLIWHHWCIKLGFTIPPNTCGKGLNIHHYGCVVINENARIGDYCNIQQCVNIGQNYSPDNVPTIGNNVYIGPGAKIFGKITIADGVAIGAGSIVTKSILEKNITVAGNPTRIIGKRKEGLN